jgi:hypothetical protein
MTLQHHQTSSSAICPVFLPLVPQQLRTTCHHLSHPLPALPLKTQLISHISQRSHESSIEHINSITFLILYPPLGHRLKVSYQWLISYLRYSFPQISSYTALIQQVPCCFIFRTKQSSTSLLFAKLSLVKILLLASSHMNTCILGGT